MIMINGNWEQVEYLSDIIRIVSENINSEFAQKVEEIFLVVPQEIFDKSKLIEDYEKDELADMVINLYDAIIRSSKTIHILLEDCARLDNKMKRKKNNK